MYQRAYPEDKHKKKSYREAYRTRVKRIADLVAIHLSSSEGTFLVSRSVSYFQIQLDLKLIVIIVNGEMNEMGIIPVQTRQPNL